MQYSDKEVGSGRLTLGIIKNRWQLPNLNAIKEKSPDKQHPICDATMKLKDACSLEENLWET